MTNGIVHENVQRGRAGQWAMLAGGFLWMIFGYFRFMMPLGRDVLWREDLGYSLILSTGLFALYNLPGVLALLLTSWTAFSLLPALQTARTGLKRAVWIVLLLTALCGLVAIAGQILLLDPLTTGGLSFGTLFLGLALFLAGLAAARTSKRPGERGGLWGSGLVLLGSIGMSALGLRPLMFAWGFLPLVIGAIAYALFGIGWIGLGLNVRSRVRQRGQHPVRRAVRRRTGWAFSTLWFLLTAGAVVLSGFLFHFPGALAPSNGELFNLNPVGALINGLATGVLVGGVQGRLVRRVGLRARRWLVGSTGGLFLVHAFGDMLPDRVALPLMVLLGGWLLGLGQWWAASWPARVGMAWTAGSGIIWTVTFWVGYRAGQIHDDWRLEHLMVAAAVGVGIGVTTAAMWLWSPVLETARNAVPQVTGKDRADTATP